VARLADNPAVIEAAAYADATDFTLSIDGLPSLLVAADPVIGHPAPVITSGREPVDDQEIALGRSTARKIHKGIGDTVTVSDDGGNQLSLELRVVGITIISDPVTSPSAAGDGAFVRLAVLSELQYAEIPQSIVVRLDPSVDRAAAIESVREDFPGSIRGVVPQADTQNLARLRTVPWLIVTLVSLLAAATLVHSLFTLLSRRRGDLAVLAALGLRRGQRREIGVVTATLLVATGTVIGVPGGVLLGRWFWQLVATRISIAAEPRTAWWALGTGPALALGIAIVVALVSGWRVTRGSAAGQLRVE
jgi:putative ABC transport system permease protein